MTFIGKYVNTMKYWILKKSTNTNQNQKYKKVAIILWQLAIKTDRKIKSNRPQDKKDNHAF